MSGTDVESESEQDQTLRKEERHNETKPALELEDGMISSEESEEPVDKPDTLLGDANEIIAMEANFHKAKLWRLQKHYNDAYIEFFNKTSNIQEHHEAGHPLSLDLDAEPFSSSQFGYITWTAAEKAKFFDVLTLSGRYDLPRISEFVGTKSQIEVKALIDMLDQAFVDRQLFERETKNVSHAEIPAAIEVSSNLEQALEQAADALQVLQEGYDLAAGQQRFGNKWIVTRELAKVLDQEFDADTSSDEESDARFSSTQNPYELFHLSNWLDISEKCFMNGSTDTIYDHWSIVAEPEQRPSCTMDTIIDFYHLTVSLTQRVLQVALFIAKTRIRASMSNARRPAKILTQSDVRAALDVLNMKHDSWEYWARLPGRSKLQVYTDEHRKGKAPQTFLEPAAVEKTLLQMSATRMSKSRSRSRGRSMSLGAVSATEDGVPVEQHAENPDVGSQGEGDSVSDDSIDVSGDEQLHPTLTRKRKRLLLEEAQDEYADRLDRRAQVRHEHGLWQLLNQPETITTPKIEDEEELGTRPKTLRKTQEDLRTRLPQYEGSWEERYKQNPSRAFYQNIV